MLRPDQKVGVLTAQAPALTPRHLAAAGATDVPVAVAGMQEFRIVTLTGMVHATLTRTPYAG